MRGIQKVRAFFFVIFYKSTLVQWYNLTAELINNGTV
jgi:hypothetical protein